MMTPEGYLQQYATRHDQAAFAEIVSHFTPLVYGLAMRRSRRAELAVEIAQDVFLTLADERHRSDPGSWQRGRPVVADAHHRGCGRAHAR